MKPNTSKKKSPLQETVSNKTPAWMTRGSDNIEKNVQRQRTEQLSAFAPTFWLNDGEVKQVRFLSSEPIAQIFQYTLKSRGKFRSYTAPGPGQPDPFQEAGLTPQMRIVYEIIDVTGYLDNKTKKQVKNVRRFWVVGSKIFENITRIRKKNGLTSYNIEVTRSGTGTSTSYALIPEENSPMPKPSTPTSLSADFAKYFAPLSEDRARQIVAGHSAEDDED